MFSKIVDWLWGDIELPESPRWRLATALVQALAVAIALIVVLQVTRVVRTTPAPAALPTTGDRFGIPETRRRVIFTDMAADEPRARNEAAQKFPGEPWSIEDERAAHERDRARELAGTYKVSVSAVYLILDEGIRAHWPAPKKPLDASVVPLKPRFR